MPVKSRLVSSTWFLLGINGDIPDQSEKGEGSPEYKSHEEKWICGSLERRREVLKRGKVIPTEKHGLLSFALIIADSR